MSPFNAAGGPLRPLRDLSAQIAEHNAEERAEALDGQREARDAGVAPYGHLTETPTRSDLREE